MKNYRTNLLPIILFFAVSIAVLSCTQQDANKETITKRGVVVYPSDLTSVGCAKWVKMAHDAGINLIGLHSDTRLETLPKLKAFLESDKGKTFLSECKKYDIDVEYEQHILMELLPRELFSEHPEYFRVDTTGNRNGDYNMCFTSREAMAIVKKNAVEMAKWIKPSSHRYFFWTDDVQLYCHCDECSKYTPSEQVLLYGNALQEALQEYDPKATVAHLAYGETLGKPEKVKPLPGVFLEYAPISRDYSKPLSTELTTHLEKNLEVFPAETTHILEYWLDVSMFSNWERDKLVKVPCSKEQCRRDVELYENLGIKSMTTFAAWINKAYEDKFGDAYSQKIIREYGEALRNK